MKFRSKFNHDFINRGCLHCAILKGCKGRDMFEMRFSRFWKCLSTTWSSLEQTVNLTQKLATETKIPQSWYSYFVTIVDHCCGVVIENL